MDVRKYDPALIDQMNHRKQIIEEDGLILIEKPVPESDEDGIVDPRVFKTYQNAAGELVKFEEKDHILSKLRKVADLGLDYITRTSRAFQGDLMGLVEPVRKTFSQIGSLKITEGVHTEEFTLFSGLDRQRFQVRVYRPEDQDDMLPIFVYLHGGGFVGGTLDGVDELCRYIAKNTPCLVLSVGYRLAPEAQYPCQLEDAATALDWIIKQAHHFKGNANQIIVGGDSAGGNLCAALTARQAKKNGHLIKAQVLLYPLLNLTVLPDRDENHNQDIYKTKPEYQKLVAQFVYPMRFLINLVPVVLGKYTLKEPDLSPIYADPMPDIPTFIAVGEYDTLRHEDEHYAKKLINQGTPVRMIRYKGIWHGYADMVGIFVQSEDTLLEICSFIRDVKAHLSR